MIWIASPGLQVSNLIYPVRDHASTKSSSWEPGFLKSWGRHSSVRSPRTVLAMLTHTHTDTLWDDTSPQNVGNSLSNSKFHQQGFIHFSNIYWGPNWASHDPNAGPLRTHKVHSQKGPWKNRVISAPYLWEGTSQEQDMQNAPGNFRPLLFSRSLEPLITPPLPGTS